MSASTALWLALAVLVVVAATTGGVMYAQNAEDAANEKLWHPLIAQTEVQHAIPAGLLERQLYQESHFRTDIITGATVSRTGAQGIAQFEPATARQYGINPLDPNQAIPAAGDMLASLHRRFGSWALALASYDWGQGDVARWIANGSAPSELPPETAAYVAEITAAVPGTADYPPLAAA